MSTKPNPSRPGHRRVRAFAPVLLRARRGGWTPMKQAAFLAQLALTGNVREAARRVGMSRETAYRLRGKPGGESFADAWDDLTKGEKAVRRRVTLQGLRVRAIYGLLKPHFYRGRHTGTARKADFSAILALNAIHVRHDPHRRIKDRAIERFAPRHLSTLERWL